MTLLVDEDSGYWNTNGTPFTGFGAPGRILWLSNSCILSVYGRDRLGNTSATNSYTYTVMPPTLRLSNAGLALNPVRNVAEVSYGLMVPPGRMAQVRLEYSTAESGMWVPVAPGDVSFPQAQGSSGTFTNLCQLPELDRSRSLHLWVRAVQEDGQDATSVVSNISLAGLFGQGEGLAGVALLHAPYRGEEPGIILVNPPPGAVVRAYTIAGSLLAELPRSPLPGRLVWNARDLEGKKVTPGVYLLHLQEGDRKKTLKVVILSH